MVGSHNNSAPSGSAVYNEGGVLSYACAAEAQSACAVGGYLTLFGAASVLSGNVATLAGGATLANYGTAYVGRGAYVGGNVGAAGAPSVFSQRWEELSTGDAIAMVVVGSGLSWSSALVEVD